MRKLLFIAVLVLLSFPFARASKDIQCVSDACYTMGCTRGFWIIFGTPLQYPVVKPTSSLVQFETVSEGNMTLKFICLKPKAYVLSNITEVSQGVTFIAFLAQEEEPENETTTTTSSSTTTVASPNNPSPDQPPAPSKPQCGVGCFNGIPKCLTKVSCSRQGGKCDSAYSCSSSVTCCCVIPFEQPQYGKCTKNSQCGACESCVNGKCKYTGCVGANT
jgi:hypothetical protein